MGVVLLPSSSLLGFGLSSCGKTLSAIAKQPPELQGEEPRPCSSERGVFFSTGPSFYRPQSSLGRDLAILAAALYKRSHGHLRVLDAMSGCGVRAVRYLVQSQADFVLANDCNQGLHHTIVENLSRYVPSPFPLHLDGSCGSDEDRVAGPSTFPDYRASSTTARQDLVPESEISDACDDDSFCGRQWSCAQHRAGAIGSLGTRWQVTHEEANRLLSKLYLNRDFFDLIDIDSFGSDSMFIGAALSAVRRDGLLYLTCTDGFSSGGHRPHNSLASYGAFVRPMPYGNELGLRMLIGGVVKEATLRKMIVSPVFSVYSSHGPVFRVLLRVSSGKLSKIKHYRFIYYCGKCGDSDAVDWESLGTAGCSCSGQISGSIRMSGPLWTGPLHSGNDIQEMKALATEWGWIPNVTREQTVNSSMNQKRIKTKKEKLCELLDLMLEESHPDLSFGYLHLDEIAKRGKIPSPRRDVLIELLQNAGYIAGRSQIASNAVKTNCPMSRCIALAQTLP